MHRNTSGTIHKCFDKLQRGTCAKNTVRFLQNDPDLTCPQCAVQLVQYTAPVPSENLSYSDMEHSPASAHAESGIVPFISTILSMLTA